MSDRHIHCVYFQYTEINSVKGHCLLKNKEIRYGFKQCCDKYVLKPKEILSYYLKHNGFCNSWETADERALEYLEKTGFNNYPKEIEE